MPEIAEVARTVHFLRKNLLGKTLKTVTAAPDDIVFGKVGTSAGEIEKSLKDRKVVDVGQQGKYFWMIMDKPPHLVMHFGMSGWFRFKGQETYYYKGKEGKNGAEEWPPKFWKFHVRAEAKGKDTVEAAFVDMRRLARVRLVNCDGKEIRKNSPLKENGPDPIVDSEIVTVEWLTGVCRKKKVPIKAMLLDQAVISGIGNWVGDEVMYHAKIHPEQYSNTLEDAQIKQLHKSIHYVCKTACDLLGDSDQFPKEWLFKHRWGKGKKSATQTLPNGAKIAFLTVGGRTSAIVPSIQKKTGPVAKDVEMSEDDGDVDEKVEAPKKSQGKKRKTAETKDEGESEDENKQSKASAPKKAATRGKDVKPTPETSKDAKARAKKKVKTEEAEEKEKDEEKETKEKKPLPRTSKEARTQAQKGNPSKKATETSSAAADAKKRSKKVKIEVEVEEEVQKEPVRKPSKGGKTKSNSSKETPGKGNGGVKKANTKTAKVEPATAPAPAPERRRSGRGVKP